MSGHIVGTAFFIKSKSLHNEECLFDVGAEVTYLLPLGLKTFQTDVELKVNLAMLNDFCFLSPTPL